MGLLRLIAEVEPTVALPSASPAARSAATWRKAEAATVPWWLWWNVLSLDAPMVAVAWAALFMREVGGRLGVAEGAALALAVWAIYTTDRLLDGWTSGSRASLRARHFFCERHRWVLAAAVALVAAMVCCLAAMVLPGREVRAGLELGLIVAAYMAGIHLGRWRMARLLPKEAAVGILFAAGTTLPWWSRGVEISFGALLCVGSFAVLCAVNCLAIECWESAKAAGLARVFTLAVAALALVLAAACFVEMARAGLLIAESAGALLMLALHGARSKLTPEALRVLVDAALLVPPMVLLLR